MRYLYVLRGLSGAGKSYLIKDHNLEAYTLSSDKYRLMCGSPIYNTEGGIREILREPGTDPGNG